jgi:ATP-dependent Lon protease
MISRIALGVAAVAATVGSYCLWRTRHLGKLEKGYFFDKKTGTWKRGLDFQHEMEMDAFQAGMEAKDRIEKNVQDERTKEYVLKEQLKRAQERAQARGEPLTVDAFMAERESGMYDDVKKEAEAAMKKDPLARSEENKPQQPS